MAPYSSRGDIRRCCSCLEGALWIVPGHHPNAGLEECQGLADQVPELYPRQVDDDRDALALPGLEHLHADAAEHGPKQTKKTEILTYDMVHHSRPINKTQDSKLLPHQRQKEVALKSNQNIYIYIIHRLQDERQRRQRQRQQRR